MLARLILLLTILPASPLLAQENGDGQTVPWYQVEVLVFKRAALASDNNELWPADPGQPIIDSAVGLLPSSSGNTENHAQQPVPFQMIESSQHQLNETLEKMLESENYQPLLHLAWRQPTYDVKQSRPVILQGGRIVSQPAPTSFGDVTTVDPVTGLLYEIEGTITVSLKRYLHLKADLLLREPPVAREVPALDPPLDNPPIMQVYRLSESRRMRSTEVHYLDHPAYGILAVITPYEIPLPPVKEEDSEVTVTPAVPVKP